MKMKFILAIAAASAMAPAFADVYEDFAAYDAGKDNSWFFELAAKAQHKGSAAQVREGLSKQFFPSLYPTRHFATLARY